MNVSKEQLVNGIAMYLDREVVHQISDVPFKILMEAAIQLALKQNNFDALFENPVVKGMILNEDGTCDLEKIQDAFMYAMNEHGNMTFKIGGIKFISPETKELTFTPDDIRKMCDYISRF